VSIEKFFALVYYKHRVKRHRNTYYLDRFEQEPFYLRLVKVRDYRG